MSALLGYDRGAQYFNDMESRNRNLQASISRVNQTNLNNYNTAEQLKQRTDKVKEQGAEARESKSFLTDAKEGAGELLAEGRNVYKLGKDLAKSRQGVQSAITNYRRTRFLDSGEATAGEVFSNTPASRVLDLGQDTSDIADEVARGGTAISRGADLTNTLRYGGEALQNTLQGSARGIGEAFTGSRSVLQAQQGAQEGLQAVRDTAQAVGTGDVAGAVDAGARVLSAGKTGLRALDSIGKTAEGLNVVSGVGDILDDMDGGFSKMNANEKVGNVAGIISAGTSAAGLAAGLEGTGAMLDATGIGAPVGLALGLAGAVAGGVSAVEDYIGGKKKQKQQTKPSAPIQKPTPIAQANVPISPLQSGGVAMSGYN